jgi:hypothetical protein
MRIIARLPSLADAYQGMTLLRANAIPPALARDGEHIVISVDEDFAEPARKLFDQHSIRYVYMTPNDGGGSTPTSLFEDENT